MALTPGYSFLIPHPADTSPSAKPRSDGLHRVMRWLTKIIIPITRSSTSNLSTTRWGRGRDRCRASSSLLAFSGLAQHLLTVPSPHLSTRKALEAEVEVFRRNVEQLRAAADAGDAPSERVGKRLPCHSFVLASHLRLFCPPWQITKGTIVSFNVAALVYPRPC